MEDESSETFLTIVKKLFFPYIFIALVLAAAITFLFMVSKVQNVDSVRINLSGRQRMLTQKMSKEILQYSLSITDKESVLATADIFERTLLGLTNGGKVPLNLEISKERMLPAMEDQETKEQLLKVLSLWKPFNANIAEFLETKDSAAFSYVMEFNVELLREMDKAVFMMQYTGEKNNRLINALLYSTYLIIMVILSLFLKRELSSLNEAKSRIRKLEILLPICSNCKKMREPNTDPYSSDSWVRVESYIEEHTESRFSHSLCPDCMQELYGDLLEEEGIDLNSPDEN